MVQNLSEAPLEQDPIIQKCSDVAHDPIPCHEVNKPAHALDVLGLRELEEHLEMMVVAQD